MAAFITTTAANAKLKVGVQAGVNLPSVTGKSLGKKRNSDISIGGRFGGLVDLQVADHICIRPGIEYNLLGGVNGDLGNDVNWLFHYINVPVDVLYTMGKEGENHFYVGLTPYIGYMVSGQSKASGVTKTLEIGSDQTKDNVLPWGFGAGVKVGYEFAKGFFVDAAFYHGLVNILPGGNGDNSIYNRNITLGGGYFFMR